MPRPQFNRYAFVITALLLLLSGCASTSSQEGFGEYIDNSLVTAKVRAGLLNHPLTRSFKIKVTTFKGVVQLSGYVSSAKARREAETIASGIEGVHRVDNKLLIRGR